MGWEIYPTDLYELLSRLRKDYDDPEMFITENGIAADDEVSSDGRIHDNWAEFIEAHLEQAAKCVNEGIQLGGYFVWTLMDNFEWECGWTQKFGLVNVNRHTLDRTVKDSGLWYRDFIAQQKQR